MDTLSVRGFWSNFKARPILEAIPAGLRSDPGRASWVLQKTLTASVFYVYILLKDMHMIDYMEKQSEAQKISDIPANMFDEFCRHYCNPYMSKWTPKFPKKCPNKQKIWSIRQLRARTRSNQPTIEEYQDCHTWMLRIRNVSSWIHGDYQTWLKNGGIMRQKGKRLTAEIAACTQMLMPTW
jgi:hypothetical protein